MSYRAAWWGCFISAALVWGVVLWTAGWGAYPRCETALSLGFDVSGSIDEIEWGLTREGTARALTSPDVRARLRESPTWVQVFEWGNMHEQYVVVPWTPATPESLQRIAGVLRSAPRSGTTFTEAGTEIGDAEIFAQRQFQQAPCDERILDMVTDGSIGLGMKQAREGWQDGRDTVNVLLIGDPKPAELKLMHDLVQFGAWGFTHVTPSFDDFEQAFTKKLLKEIS